MGAPTEVSRLLCSRILVRTSCTDSITPICTQIVNLSSLVTCTCSAEQQSVSKESPTVISLTTRYVLIVYDYTLIHAE